MTTEHAKLNPAKLTREAVGYQSIPVTKASWKAQKLTAVPKTRMRTGGYNPASRRHVVAVRFLPTYSADLASLAVILLRTVMAQSGTIAG